MSIRKLDPPKSQVMLKPWQLWSLAGPLIVLVLYTAYLCLQKPDYVSLLWTDTIGVKMFVTATILLAVGSVIFLAGCVAINAVTAKAWGAGASLAQFGLMVVWVVLFFAPAVFVVAIGPAAIQIQRTLTQP